MWEKTRETAEVDMRGRDQKQEDLVILLLIALHERLGVSHISQRRLEEIFEKYLSLITEQDAQVEGFDFDRVTRRCGILLRILPSLSGFCFDRSINNLDRMELTLSPRFVKKILDNIPKSEVRAKDAIAHQIGLAYRNTSVYPF